MHRKAFALYRRLPQPMRFGVLALVGTGVDILVTAIIQQGAGWPLFWAAIAGYLSGNVTNYALHSRYVYHLKHVWDARRYVKYLIATLGGLVARLLAVTVLVWCGAPQDSLVTLLAAVAASFTINYLATTFWAMRPRAGA